MCSPAPWATTALDGGRWHRHRRLLGLVARRHASTSLSPGHRTLAAPASTRWPRWRTSPAAPAGTSSPATRGPTCSPAARATTRCVATAGDDVLDGGTGIDTVDYSARPRGRRREPDHRDRREAGRPRPPHGARERRSATSGGRSSDRRRRGEHRSTAATGTTSCAGSAGADTLDGRRTGPTRSTIRPSSRRTSGSGWSSTSRPATRSATAPTRSRSIENVRRLQLRRPPRRQRPGQHDFRAGTGPRLPFGGAGKDVLRGGDGNDTLQARDGFRDQVYGDADRDRGRVDRGRDVVRSVAVCLCSQRRASGGGA